MPQNEVSNATASMQLACVLAAASANKEVFQWFMVVIKLIVEEYSQGAAYPSSSPLKANSYMISKAALQTWRSSPLVDNPKQE